MAGTVTEQTPLVQGKSDLKPSPPKWRSYYELTRLHKFPAGAILVFWPCAWALTLAAYRINLPYDQLILQTAAYFVGGTLLHSAACVINDICDRDFDRQVERCKNRPIASGAVSIPGATVFLLIMVVGCIAMLACTNLLAFEVGMIGIFPLHALYPLMKRWTWWPQAWLGLAMNWGLPTAWVGLTGSIDWQILPVLFAGTVCWTLVYDTIYGLQDRKDDVKAGVKSTALLFGDWVRPIVAGFAVIFVATLAYAGVVNHQGPWYFVLTVGGAALHFTWQLVTLKIDEPLDCWRKFNANGDIGYIIWAGMLVDYYLKVVA